MDLYCYRIEIESPEKIHDGDSGRLSCDLGLHMWVRNRAFRIAEIDTPELAPKHGTSAERAREKAAAIRARDHLRTRVAAAKKLAIRIAGFEGAGDEKYPRLLCLLYADSGDGEWVNLGQELIAAKLARPYAGGTKSTEPWP